ncbi:hypothetical protein Tco_0196047 [Tanacetum coccineum]
MCRVGGKPTIAKSAKWTSPVARWPRADACPARRIKLQSLKNDIKLWTKEAKSRSSGTKLSIQNKLFEVDKIIDQGGSNEEILNRRSTPLKDLHDTKAIEALDIAQKAKILKYPWQRRSGCCYLVFLVRIHGALNCSSPNSRRSPWLDIIRETNSLLNKGIDLLAFIRKKVGNEEDTLFWDETWLGEKSLKYQFPRLYALEECKLITVAEKMRHDGLSSFYRCCPRGGAAEYLQSLLQARVTDLVLPQMLNRWT